MERVVVGMSGGVDSFVTTLMLQKRGYEVIGVTLDLWGEQDTRGVERICHDLGIQWICKEGRELFERQVVRPFVDGYLAGCTPNPCCRCNREVKWHLLKEVADELQVTNIATGHYIRITEDHGKYYILKGVDPAKDQSYFLWNVPQTILSRAMTPLGDFTKAEVKAWAIEHGYEQMARKRESMGVCFLRGTDYRDFILAFSANREAQRGNIVNREGEILGEHNGILNYTVGQKKGIPLLNDTPLYVAHIDAAANVIVADVKSALHRSELLIDQVCIVDPAELQAPDITVKIRGLGLNPEGYAKLTPLPSGRLHISLSNPAWAIAPAQPVALYRGERLIGGGVVALDSLCGDN